MNNFLETHSALNNFQSFIHFLACYIYDRTEGSPEEAAAFIGSKSWPEVDAILSEGKIILKLNPLPWEALRKEANVSAIKDENTARAWLENILNIIEQNRPNNAQ